MTPTILTRSGSYFDFSSPETSRIDIDTIAHSLAHICRFTGHTSSFYSVAQHSVLVSHLVPAEHALAGLLHDASEAYVGDVASPLKSLLPDYRAIERRVEVAVLTRFGLSADLPACVRHADLQALATESRDLMPPHDATPWACIQGIPPHPNNIVPMQSYIARKLFLARFHEIASAGKNENWQFDSIDWSAA
jgi:hypothetical protein